MTSNVETIFINSKHKPMADYLTLPVIARRLGYKSFYTIYGLIDKRAFPAYQRFNRKWYTNDKLIHQWELQQTKQAREKRARRRLEREAREKTPARSQITDPVQSTPSTTDPEHDKD